MTECSITKIGKIKDITGQKFGRLTVECMAESETFKPKRWKCRCDCGNQGVYCGNKLRSGQTQSCGCLQKERASIASSTHGMSKSPEYTSWMRMIERCENPKCDKWHRYGGRGITVCERWRNSFEAFFADVGYKPSPKHSIDRIDNEKGYYPENCKWSTQVEQSRNMISNVYLEFNGKRQTLCEWADEIGIGRSSLCERIKKGWSVERAITTPPRKW